MNWQLVLATVVIYLLLGAFHIYYRKQFIQLADPKSQLKRRRLWDFLFFATQGIITVLIVPIAGVLLAYSFLMIPAAIAAMFFQDWTKAVFFGWSIGFVACLIGLFSSYNWNWPYGPSLVLSMGLFFLIAILIRSLKSGAPAVRGGSLS